MISHPLLSEDLKFGKIFLKTSDSDSLNMFKTNKERYGTLTCHCKICNIFVSCAGCVD